MATPGSTACVISGLPLDITLGDVEALVSPKCSGRIISIAIEGEGIANVDFALQADCETMLGDHLVKGGTVKISRPGEPVLPPMRPAGFIQPAKRTRDDELGMPVGTAAGSQAGLPAVPSVSVGASSSSISMGLVSPSYDGAAVMMSVGLPAVLNPAATTVSGMGLSDGLLPDGMAPPPPAAKKQ